ncbi:MAG: D-hexose-6-phosphate mutarotase [Mariprofundaceae bacterium]|nr:D-hexose-6-phosphate mutarotase [Mariprofundaceae bacterium]
MHTLNQDYGMPGILVFSSGKGGMPVAHISNHLGSASIALQGAHILSFQAKGEDELIWMSEDASFASKKSLRGGVPVCWPWFGPHQIDSSLPAHGYARTCLWKPIASQALNDGSTYLCFELNHDSVDKHLQVHPLHVKLHITVGTTLCLQLETTNTGDTPYALSEALHTYFKVGDVRNVHIQGLDGCDYLDKTNDFVRKQQQGDVIISQETDRVYLDATSCLRIHDAELQRTIIIESEHSHTVIVWNPWIDTANKMGDLGQNGYLNMLCVETANAAQNTIMLAPNENHRMRCEYRIESPCLTL